MDLEQKAVDTFINGHNCCQAIVMTFGEQYGIDPETSKRMGRAFGGGMGRLGLVCGAVSGALMAIGLALEASQNEKETRVKAAELGREFIQCFIDRYDTILCKELLGADMLTDEGRQKIEKEKLFDTFCPQLVRFASEVLNDLLIKRDK
jgi:C_GCAxxG_C_C family probable redox protein